MTELNVKEFAQDPSNEWILDQITWHIHLGYENVKCDICEQEEGKFYNVCEEDWSSTICSKCHDYLKRYYPHHLSKIGNNKK